MDSFVPEHVTLHMLWIAVSISLACSITVGIMVSIVEVDIRRIPFQAVRNTRFLFAFSFPLALVALISGYLSTTGRLSAVGQLLPAVLTLIGALNLYVFGTENKYRVVISYCICVFAITLFYGTQYGAYQRDATREFRLQQLIGVEARLKVIRRNLRLGDDFPTWLLGTEPK